MPVHLPGGEDLLFLLGHEEAGLLLLLLPVPAIFEYVLCSVCSLPRRLALDLLQALLPVELQLLILGAESPCPSY